MTYVRTCSISSKKSQKFSFCCLNSRKSCHNKYHKTYKSWKCFNNLPTLKDFTKILRKNPIAKKSLTRDQNFSVLSDFHIDDKNELCKKKTATVIAYYGAFENVAY